MKLHRRHDLPDLRTGLLSVVVISLSGCWSPPAVQPAHDPDWTLEASDLPSGAQLAEALTHGDCRLRGIEVSCEPETPWVVHFLESGSSTTASVFRRNEFEQLAQMGYSSLCLDYRGVGRSDGTRSPRHIARDARAMYDAALARVDGDESRLILRGTSLGTLAIGTLLDQGARPAGIVLHAPVRGETVARHFAAAAFPGALWVPLVQPFVRSVTSVDLLDQLEHSNVPLLVFGHPEDELLGAEETDQLRQAVERAGGTWHQPSLTRMTSDLFPLSDRLTTHIAVALRAIDLDDVERAWIRSVIPAPNVDGREERLWTRAPTLRDEIERQPEARDRLRSLMEHHLLDDAKLLVAAALSPTALADASGLLNMERKTPAFTSDTTLDTMVAWCDLTDPRGDIPSDAVASLRWMLELLWTLQEPRPEDVNWSEGWTPSRLEALHAGLWGSADDETIRWIDQTASPTPAAPHWFIDRERPGHVISSLGSELQWFWPPSLEREDLSAPENQQRQRRALYRAAGRLRADTP